MKRVEKKHSFKIQKSFKKSKASAKEVQDFDPNTTQSSKNLSRVSSIPSASSDTENSDASNAYKDI